MLLLLIAKALLDLPKRKHFKTEFFYFFYFFATHAFLNSAKFYESASIFFKISTILLKDPFAFVCLFYFYVRSGNTIFVTFQTNYNSTYSNYYGTHKNFLYKTVFTTRRCIDLYMKLHKNYHKFRLVLEIGCSLFSKYIAM